jgi:hypothetical protein
VSFASNLRLAAQTMTEDQWSTVMRTRTGLPPMPWTSLHRMDERDLRAVFDYIKSLPVKGEPAPAPLPPSAAAKGP